MTFEELQKANSTLSTMDIKGKAYVLVNERIKAFRMLYPNGTISTELLSDDGNRCVFRAVVRDEEEHCLGTGHAYEVESSSYINKTSYIENCVPLDTQILTEDGWKYYYQLKLYDKVYGVDLATGEVELTKLLEIKTFKDAPLINMSTSRFNATCTPDHKWIVAKSNGDIIKRETQGLKISDKIIQNFRKDKNIIGTEMGKKLGWLLCDCEINRTKNGMPSTAYINQSKHIDGITALFGVPTTKSRTYNDKWLDNYEWIISAEEVRNILGYFGIADYADVPKAMCRAEIHDVAGCFESMMLADGSSRGFSSTYKDLVEAVQIMCVRLGLATTFITERICEKATRPLYTLGIKKTTGAYFSEIKTKSVPPRDVWCPSTLTGNWFMRQGSFVTLTSNCETSAVGRALAMAGIGIDTSVASYEEVDMAVKKQEQSDLANKPIDDIKKQVLEGMCRQLGWEYRTIFPKGVTEGQYKQAADKLRKQIEKKGKA